ncbi:MAG: hypothetical protein E3J72_08130 [Planctomycetota bacterium]|nr:MAG: hypothetical protein E3J72_08130 [Planctomycetota bacterium]
MGDQSTYFKPSVGDRYLRDWLRGVKELFEGCILSGCALSDGGGLSLSISSGKLYIGGFCVDYNTDSYTLADDDTSYIYAELNETDNSEGKLINYSFDFAANSSDSSSADYYMKVGEVTTASGSITLINATDRSPKAVSSGHFNIELGDAAGAKEFRVLDSSGACVFAVDSDGNATTGWHGSATRIKILPRDFISDDAGNPEFMAGANNQVITGGVSAKLVAAIPIPTGFKATAVRVYANLTKNVTVYEADINSVTITGKGTGDTSAEIDITDVTSDGTNFLRVQVESVNGAGVYGGYVTIAKA